MPDEVDAAELTEFNDGMTVVAMARMVVMAKRPRLWYCLMVVAAVVAAEASPP